jgi:hypothetical protein
MIIANCDIIGRDVASRCDQLPDRAVRKSVDIGTVLIQINDIPSQNWQERRHVPSGQNAPCRWTTPVSRSANEHL